MAFKRDQTKNVGVDDLIMLSEVSEKALLENLKDRYKEGLIYTSIGPVLISMNPYKQLGIYGQDNINLYKGKHEFEIPPHIFKVADKAYRALKSEGENQCIIISGESGAGKTEASKYIMQYIASITGSSDEVERVKKTILESNPLLEAFGNAKTLRNNNSSRFGKYMEIQFNLAGDPEGGKITNYLLEKSRVINQTMGERNFHIFYQLLKGSSAEEKQSFCLLPPEQYSYLNKGRCYSADGIDDELSFKQTKNAMKVVGIDEKTQREIFSTLSAILLLGNVTFNAQGTGSVVSDKKLTASISNLLGVEPSLLESALVSRMISTGQGARISNYQVPQNVEQALYARDAFAKAIYSKLFDFIVRKINTSIEVKTIGKVIGVLDIYGFEIFENNSFEQFCINYVNETLQQIFIDLTLKTEQEEYVQEGIKWIPVEYINNKPCVELIEKKPIGILALLDEECLFPEGNDQTMIDKLNKHFSNNSHYSKVERQKNSQFIINHYAGKVFYNIDGFLDKNRDTLFNDLVILATSSSMSLISEIFKYVAPIETDAEQEKKNLDKFKKNGFANTSAKSYIPTDKKRPITAGFQFKNQVSSLLKSLYSCNPHYVRCIKPNENKRALEWDQEKCSEQVRYLGLYENLLVRRAGYCYRQTFTKFMRRYYMVAKSTWPKWSGDAQKGVELLLNELNIPKEEFQFGKTKIFIRNPQPLFLLEEKRTARLNELATLIGATWKMYKQRKWYLQTLAARKIQRAYRGWLLRRECVKLKNQSQNIFINNKERNRKSIQLSSIAFIGDFLSLAKDQYTVNSLKQQEGQNSELQLSVNVSKVSRHHKIQKRALLITNENVYPIHPHKPKKDGSWFTIKRKIPFSSIDKISFSKLCDDFFVIHVNNEHDYVCETIRKTVFITLLSNLYQKQLNKQLVIEFNDSIHYRSQKGPSELKFVKVEHIQEKNPQQPLNYSTKSEKNSLKISVLPGLPVETRSVVVGN
ncbi:myosin IA heavy chain [Dictyostelium purpureum]|uniref:Myosin IA heavy chain n=1 Tax=Dictyostelium purpureum TaxID=5786 RepID=F0ZZR8_DICPU|nr:myosin IA heavy chain [Dictyostelium purpureum]EGC30567.1 myosin IA heavy chain [Dictyostelium purpureum]|eukprot:XP_003292908.1 myosin IA heavy chain [Dictyostelium purpureum]